MKFLNVICKKKKSEYGLVSAIGPQWGEIAEGESRIGIRNKDRHWERRQKKWTGGRMKFKGKQLCHFSCYSQYRFVIRTLCVSIVYIVEMREFLIAFLERL